MHINVRLRCAAIFLKSRAASLCIAAVRKCKICAIASATPPYTRPQNRHARASMKMYAWKLLFMFCVFIPLTYQGVAGNLESAEKSEEISKTEDDPASVEVGIEAAGRNQSEPMGPPDSHEAMNNRELKPKLTIGERRKRSYEFLVGLVKRNASVYEVTKQGKATPPPTDADVKASEILLELLVKIAANPQQWSSVHELLQKIDNDLIKSKELVDNIKTSPIVRDDVAKTKELDFVAPAAPFETTRYPWQLPTKAISHVPPATYQKNFAYHRVTGNPLTHSPASSKNTKAYIAVSVIAPKPAAIEDDRTLENELKELKPWSHQQNLKNMADIRSRWVIQSDKEPHNAP